MTERDEYLMKKKTLVLMAVVLSVLALLVATAAVAAAQGLDWSQVNKDGFGITVPGDSWEVDCMTVFNGKLYASSWDTTGKGCTVWRYDDGTTWTQVNENGFGTGNNWSLSSLASFDGNLYAGTYNGFDHCQVWRYDGGTTWTRVNENGFGDSNGMAFLGVYQNKLYAGTQDFLHGCQVWRYDGGMKWTQVNEDGFGIATPENNGYAWSLTVFDGNLYSGTANNTNGCQVWRYDGGTTWSQVNTSGFGIATPGNNGNANLLVYDGKLYAGAFNRTNGSQVWRYDGGTTWTKVNQVNFQDNTWSVFSRISMAAFNGKLYAGVGGSGNGCQVWRYDDGTTWTQTNTDGFGTNRNVGTYTMVAFNGRLYAGTENRDGSQVWAGGNTPTGQNVEVNPDPNVNMEFEDVTEGGATTVTPQSTLPEIAGYRVITGYDINTDATFTGNVNVTIAYDNTGVTPSEESRLMMLHQVDGKWTDITTARDTKNHKVTGQTTSLSLFMVALPSSISPSTTWYLAEGSTGTNELGSFETWVLVQNPGSETANVSLTYMTPSGEVTGPTMEIGAGSRQPFNVADTPEVANEFSVSTRVTSDKPVIAERAMYWNSIAGVYRQAAHDSIGACQ